MEIWILWIVLTTGERLQAGQYQSEERCYVSAQVQRPFWLGHRPRPVRMECRSEQLWQPSRG